MHKATSTPIRFDLMVWVSPTVGMARFDSGTTLGEAISMLRAHAIVGDEYGADPLNAEIWAIYSDGTTNRIDV